MRRLQTLSGHLMRGATIALPLPAAIVLSLAILGAAASARAELRVDITRGHVEPLPIALVDLAGANEADADVGRQITEVITRNLERSGLFRPIDPAAFIIEPGGMTVRPRFQDWRIINAQALVTGRVVPGDPGRLTVEFRLWDVFAEQDLIGLKLSGAREAWRSIAHTMSDKIYERLTGESGYLPYSRRLHRRDRAARYANQATRDHGPGRPQPALPVGRQAPGAHAAFFADGSGDYLSLLRAGRAQGVPPPHRHGPAGAARQLPPA